MPTGRQEVVGQIVAVEWRDQEFGGAWKMLVRSDAGWRVWGSIPLDLRRGRWGMRQASGAPSVEDLEGERVSFVATIKPSADDHTFGIATRPSKGKILPRPLDVAAQA